MSSPKQRALPKRRVPCEHCERKFVDEAALARHAKTVHKKSAKLVAELRAKIRELSADLQAEAERQAGASL